MDLTKDWREFIGLLNSNEVEFLMIGTLAVAFHAHEATGRPEDSRDVIKLRQVHGR